MKKLFTIAIMLLAGLTANAQEKNDSIRDIDMNRTFNAGGKALMCLRSANAEKRDLKPLTWTLENNRIGDQNIVLLKVVNAKTGETEAMQTWNGNVNIAMRVNEKDKTKSYFILDDTFYHLRILDIGQGVSVILLYSDLKDSQEEVKF